MYKTYITNMEDKAGAFLVASKIISDIGGNIVRVNYNKAVDMHTLFIDVKADSRKISKITKALSKIGYLSDNENKNKVILVEFKLIDEPGRVVPILEIIGSFNINITYISSQENGSGYQNFKMGLLIENAEVIKELLDKVSKLCKVKILQYDYTQKVLDSTVFYLDFSAEMRDMLNLTQDETNEVIVNSNKIMQMLDERGERPFKTFEYIRNFARFITAYKGVNFNPVITKSNINDIKTVLIEPPCGSNIIIMEKGNDMIISDGGFPCYVKETLRIIKSIFPNFEKQNKVMFLTHSDIDHSGLIPYMDKVYASKECYDNFALEHMGKDNYREQNPLNTPYTKLSEIICGYKTPNLDNFKIIGEKIDDLPLSKIGEFEFMDLKFSVLEGYGGHVKGETIFICDEYKFVLTGDNIVNIKGFSKEQAEFNILAPYLMTSVNVDSKKATVIRKELKHKTKGYLICPGHGKYYQD